MPPGRRPRVPGRPAPHRGQRSTPVRATSGQSSDRASPASTELPSGPSWKQLSSGCAQPSPASRAAWATEGASSRPRSWATDADQASASTSTTGRPARGGLDRDVRRDSRPTGCARSAPDRDHPARDRVRRAAGIGHRLGAGELLAADPVEQRREVVGARIVRDSIRDADLIEWTGSVADTDRDDGHPVIVQRSHQIAVQPGQLGRDDRDSRLVPQRDTEQLSMIDTSAHELDTQLTTLQAAHERRFPRSAAGARDHTDRDECHGSSETSKRVARPVRDSVRGATTSTSPLRTANATKTTSSGATETVNAVSSPSRCPNSPSAWTTSTTCAPTRS